jgi:hypothetical protein
MAGNRLISRIHGLFIRLSRILPSISSSSIRYEYSAVEQDEDINRFVVHSSDIQKSTASLHYKRLLPRRNKSTERFETSVCRSKTLTEKKLWAICTDFFDTHAQAPAIGVGIAKASIVYAAGLNFDPNGKPFPQHADIVGWYDDPRLPDDETKHFRMDKAQQMAPHFKYSPRPPEH